MHSQKVLEFDKILAELSSRCETEMAAGSALELQPSFLSEDVWILLDRTEEALQCINQNPPPSLAIKDVQRSVQRASKGGTLGGKELFEIGSSAALMRAFKGFFAGKASPHLTPFIQQLTDQRKVEEDLLQSLESDGDVRSTASPQLQSLRQKKSSASSRLTERIQSYVSGRTRDLLSDPLYTVRDGRYVLPLKAENRGKIKGIVHDTSASGQTIFLEPDDVLQLANGLREIEAAEQREIQRILVSLSQKVGAIATDLLSGLAAATALDLCFAKARLAADWGGALPERLTYPRIEMDGGRHPLLEREKAVPLDMRVGKGDSVLITGPNTGGKTVSIKTVGLFVLMLQSGLLPPARNVRFGTFSQVWADIGDEQSLSQSLSTFSGHIKNIAEALRGLKPGGLVLLDEVGAGTDPTEGAALAKAILSELHAKGACVLASTHYGELKAFAYETAGFTNAAMEFDVKTLRPTYRLRLGTPGASQALRIAERYGIAKPIIEQARQALSTQETDVARMLERLEEAQKLARTAQGEADRRLVDLKRKEETATRKLAEADEIRRTAHSRATQIIEDALRELRLEHADALERLKSNPEEARQRIQEVQQRGKDLAASFEIKQQPALDSPEVSKGMSVRVQGYSQVGVVTEAPKGGKVKVQVGALRLTVDAGSVQPTSPVLPRNRSTVQLSLQKAMNASTEVSLRNMRYEDAERELERFIDDSLLSGVEKVRIVHGKGEGILRKMTHDYLRKHLHVKEFFEAEPGDGGQGVTVAVLA